MTLLNILVYVALIGYILFKKVQGQPIKAPKKLLGLPIVLVVLGFGDLTSGKTMTPVEVVLTVIGAILSLGLGLMRGQTDKISTRDGAPFAQWGKVSLALFGANIVAKLVLDLIGVAAGGTTATAGQSLIFTLGLTLLGEAVVLWMRSGGATTLINSRPATSAKAKDPRPYPPRPPQPSAHRFDNAIPLAEPSRYQLDDQTDRPARSRAASEQNDGLTGRSANLHDGIGWLRDQVDQRGEKFASNAPPSRSLVDAIEQHHSHHHDHKHDHGHRHDHDRP
jgi:hypothetical protein